MKNLRIFFGVSLIFFPSFFSHFLTAQEVDLPGRWIGVFMEQFNMIVDFEKEQDGSLSGNLKMYDKSQQIQNDLLTDISAEGPTVTFYIPAKNTYFKAEKHKQALTGCFIFPDESQHFVKLVKELSVEKGKGELVNKTVSIAQANADLDFLTEKLLVLHPSLFEFETEEDFNNLVNSTKKAFSENMSVTDYYLQIAPVFSSIGCSHTVMRLPENIRFDLQQSGNYFPAKLFFSNGKAYLLATINTNADLDPGVEILNIKGREIDTLQNELFKLISSEGNELSTKYYFLNKNFSDYFILLDDSNIFEIVYKRRDGTTGETQLNACNYKDLNNFQKTPSNTVLPDFPVAFQPHLAKGYSLLSVPTFACRDINKYNWFLDSVFVYLNENNVKNLVIDLRGNEGGHPIFAAQLFSYLAKEPFVYFDQTEIVEELGPLYTEIQPNPVHYQGKTFVLVDGGCLSTTGHLISLLKYYHLATIVGQEPGSSYKCNDKSQQIVLPHSGIEINIPTAVFLTHVDGFNSSSSMLDIKLEPGVDDVLNQTDKSLETVTRIIELQNADF